MQTLIEKVQTLDDTFKVYHYIIADQAGEDAVESEPGVLYKCEDKVFFYSSRLRKLLEGSEPADVPTLSTDPFSICINECAKQTES